MYLLILESIGTQELILVGMIALIVFGPRKLPEMARKLGSMMTEFRKVSSDFRSTWENAVNLENVDETKKIEPDERPSDYFEIEHTIHPADSLVTAEESEEKVALPEVREVSSEEYQNLMADKKITKEPAQAEKTEWL